jgi:hypothetical protein
MAGCVDREAGGPGDDMVATDIGTVRRIRQRLGEGLLLVLVAGVVERVVATGLDSAGG